tara:strand:- start:3536 stop:7984 length:4449 start_codon:yes stop_codon:yes gene_type:complete
VATNEIVFSVKVQKDGNLSVIAKEANAAADGTENLGKQTDSLSKKRRDYQKVEKGVGQAGLSTAKGFSKQAGAISGGLVPAYAILAANIFAITAAFNALKEAAQVKALEEGFSTLGNVVGRTSSLMANEMVKITDGAIAMDAALRSSAAGFSAGFNMAEMKGLTEIAKGASIALGRDLGDALDRLVRGTAKLEPEILDELGLFIRLDDAAAKYAQTLNKSVGALTQTERRQAFLNEALEQGERKFSSVMNLETNPFDRLSAAASNLAKGLLSVINVAVVPFIELLNTNMYMLIGVLVMFGNTVASHMLPALYGIGQAQRERGDEALEAAEKFSKAQDLEVKSIEKNIRVQETAMGKTTKFSALQGNLGTENEKEGDVDAMLKSLKRGKTARETFMKKDAKNRTALRQKETLEIKALIEELEKLDRARAGKGEGAAALELQEGLAGIQDDLADNMSNISKAGPLAGFAEAFRATQQYSAGMGDLSSGITAATGPMGWLSGILPRLGAAFGTAGVGVRLFGVALINAIPVIGQILFVGGLVVSLLSKWLGATTNISAAQNQLNDVVDSMGDKFEQLNEALTKSVARSGLLSEAFDKNAEKGFQLTSEMKMLQGVVLESQEAFMGLTQALDENSLSAGDKLKSRWSMFFNWYKETWVMIGDGALGILNKIGDALPDGIIPDSVRNLFGRISDAVIGSDTDVANELLRNAFIEPLEEMISLGNNIDQVRELFASMKIDPEQPGAVRDLANALEQQAISMVASGKAVDANGKALTVTQTFSMLLNKEYKKLSDTTDELAERTIGAAKAFEESSQSIRSFFSKETGKDTFLTMANDAKELSKALSNIKGNGESAQAVLDNIKKGEGGWLRSFFGSKKEFDESTIEDIAPILAEIETRSKKISEQQKNSALNTKVFAAQIKVANNELKYMKQAFKFNEFVGLQNVFGKSLETSKEITKQILVLKNKELELQKRIFKNKRRQIDMEMDFKINEIELLRMQEGMDATRYALLGEQLQLLRLLKMEKRDALDIENDTTEALIKQNSFRALMAKANTKSVIGSGSLGSKLVGMRALGSAKDTVKANKDQIVQSARDEYLAGNTLPSSAMSGPGQNLRGHSVNDGGGTQVNVSDLNAAGEAGFDSAMYQAGLVDLQNQVMLTDAVLKSMQESLKNFGPDGELIIAFSTGMNTATSGFIQMASALGDKNTALEDGAAIAAGVASAISAAASIMTAASNARIAAIDKEIAAEQRRDGKSKASLAKIKSLEAKKEAMARKAFESNKKMMMAQTIANTAAAVMGILAIDSARVGSFAIPMAIAVGAMGAAQLAIIAGTSYQGGGGSAGGVTGPSQISVGKRRDTVDISKSKSASGELAYFRGEQGTGGPENFTRAFSGYKHRASGGNTGYIVGEQGPELFMPDRPGTIVPADDTAQLGGGSNVTFNINTVDASGVEDLLVEQQGNIIGMLRQAANSYGQDFFEDIDETTYTSPFARRA